MCVVKYNCTIKKNDSEMDKMVPQLLLQMLYNKNKD